MINLTRTQRQRLQFILFTVTLIALALALILFALRQNINLYYTPSELSAVKLPANLVIRVGGLVKPHSLVTLADKRTQRFIITDQQQALTVTYKGALPDLFRDGQGIVAQGRLREGVFIAQQVLAKHDENYRPPTKVA